MALQSSLYNTDGSTKTFPSTKHIATKQHVAVYKKRVSDNVWVIVPVLDFSLINNSVVFNTAPDMAIYSQIEVRVADTANELEDNPSDIAIIATGIANINTVATNIASVNTTSTNIASVKTVSGSIANVNATGASIANVNTVAVSIANVNTVAGSIANVNSVATTVVPNIAEILLADDNAVIATTKAGIATTQAGLANDSATEAKHWANYTVDVAVPEGTGEFSAKHYATKASQTASTINTDTTFVRKDSNTGAASMPSGTTAQRKPAPVVGDTRWNTTLGATETWSGTQWISASGQMLGTATTKAISYNSQVINENITIPADVNFSMVGTVTIGNGYQVVISDGARGVVL